MNLDAPRTSSRSMLCLAFLAFSGCDALTQFEFTVEEHFEIPGRSAAPAPPGRVVEGEFGQDAEGYDQVRPAGLTDIELSKNQAFSDNGVGIDQVDSIKLMDVTVTAQPESVRDPYAYLDGLRFVVVVGDEEIELAGVEGADLYDSERILVIPGTGVDLKPMLQQAATISVRLKGNQPLGNRAFSIVARFNVDLF